jgi:hypothetical protein
MTMGFQRAPVATSHLAVVPRGISITQFTTDAPSLSVRGRRKGVG